MYIDSMKGLLTRSLYIKQVKDHTIALIKKINKKIKDWGHQGQHSRKVIGFSLTNLRTMLQSLL